MTEFTIDTHGAYKPVDTHTQDTWDIRHNTIVNTYEVGDRVQVRMSDDADWVDGAVTQVGPHLILGEAVQVAVPGGPDMTYRPESDNLRFAEKETTVTPSATSFTVTREFLEDVRSLLSQRMENRVEVKALVLMKVDDLIGPVVPEPKTAQQVIAEGIVRCDYHHPPEDGQVEFQAAMEGYQDQARSVLSALESAGFRVLHEGGKVRDDS